MRHYFWCSLLKLKNFKNQYSALFLRGLSFSIKICQAFFQKTKICIISNALPLGYWARDYGILLILFKHAIQNVHSFHPSIFNLFEGWIKKKLNYQGLIKGESTDWQTLVLIISCTCEQSRINSCNLRHVLTKANIKGWFQKGNLKFFKDKFFQMKVIIILNFEIFNHFELT